MIMFVFFSECSYVRDFLQLSILETQLGIKNLTPLFLDMEVIKSE